MIDWDVIVGLAGRLADAAGQEIRPRFQQEIPTERKADVTPVTEADRAAETAIRALLAADRPQDAVIGEEYGRTAGTSGLTWVIDPIDGTKAFMTGRATFVTLIALLDGDQPVLGVVDQPITGDRWIGVKDRQTTHNGRPARTRRIPDIQNATFSTTDPNMFPADGLEVYRRISSAAGMRTYGGDGLAYGLLASGWIDIVLEAGLKLHDFAAIVPVVEGAGGVVSDWAGKPINAQSDGHILVTGSAELHARSLALI